MTVEDPRNPPSPGRCPPVYPGAMRALWVLGSIGLWGCHLMLPFGGSDGPAGDRGRPDGPSSDRVRPDGTSVPDRAVSRDSGPDRPRNSERPPAPDKGSTLDKALIPAPDGPAGITWEKVTPLLAISDDLLDVSGSSASDVFVVGGNRVLHYGGTQGWVQVPTGIFTGFAAVAVPDIGEALVGSLGGLLTCSANGCGNLCPTTQPLDFRGVWADVTDYAFVGIGIPSTAAGLWTNCQPQAGVPWKLPRAIWKGGTDFFVVHGDGISSTPALNPGSWVPVLKGVSSSLNDVHGGLAVGDGGAAYRWDVNSKKWTQEYTTLSGSPLASLKGVWSDGTLSLAVGVEVVGGQSYGVILRQQAPGGWVQDSLPQTTPPVPQLNAVWVSPLDGTGSRKAFAVGVLGTILQATLK